MWCPQQVLIMNVLSLFDGMSCGQIALNRAGIKYNKYYASEIDKFAIRVTQKHFPNTVQLGDVREITKDSLDKIDLLIGGSPCQGFSVAGKRLNFDDPRSKLFFEYVRLLKECKPKYFLLENVRMKKEHLYTITRFLGVKPVKINSDLVSAQQRTRYYWTNIPFVIPEQRGIGYKEIIEDPEFSNIGRYVGRYVDKDGKTVPTKSVKVRQVIESIDKNKTNCVTTVSKDNILTNLPFGRHVNFTKKDFRYLTVRETCKLQTVDPDHFEGIISDNQARKCLGNGWTVDLIVEILKGMEL